MTADEPAPTASSAALPGDAQAREAAPGPEPAPRPEPAHRPIFERVGMASVALVVAVLFGGIGVAAWIGGEPFLGIMAAVGAAMTAWAGANTLFRG